jgi:restriction endonuclease/uncharacterized protein DUF4062
MKIFVSARFDELYVERKAAIEAIHFAGHTPVYIESEPIVRDLSAADTIRTLIEDSDAFVSIHFLSEGRRTPLLGDMTPIEFEITQFTRVHRDAPVLLFRREVDAFVLPSAVMIHWFEHLAHKLRAGIFSFKHPHDLQAQLLDRLRHHTKGRSTIQPFADAPLDAIENLAPGTARQNDVTLNHIITASEAMWSDVIRRLSREPRELYALDPRKFEELVAELLTRDGANVTLTPSTRDGGRDLLVNHRTPIGSHFYLVECKRYAAERPVGVSVVRGFYGVVAQERATAGLLVTTSTFTPAAFSFQSAIRHQLTLQEYTDVAAWIRRHDRLSRGLTPAST